MNRSVAALAVALTCCLLTQAAPGPLSPEAALQVFQTEPGLVVESVAAEPDVIDPVALAFDERGRLFVVENRGYPVSTNAEGTVACLTDEDGDGRYEHRTLFASGLRFPNGLMPWQGGWFITDAPDFLYLKDTDGDGRADLRRVVLTGFSTNQSTQLRCNDPTLALDGWIYLATGLSGAKVTAPGHPDFPPIDLARRDLRFHPHTERFEDVDGQSQFGLAFDDVGRRFICMNRIQVQHVVLESRQLLRNPHLAFSRTVQDLPEERVDDLIPGNAPAAARLYPISDNVTTADSHAGTFSAACAVTIWRGGNLPQQYNGRVFSCDPTANVVHWDDLIPAGATFRARRSTQPIEFLASPDNWFRPVYLAEGPDGGLYVCDMYRKTIEHPEYLPEEVRKRTDFDGGKDKGRIWRVRSTEHSKPIAMDLSASRLVGSLRSPSSWQRQTAFRLLCESRAKDALPLLRPLVGNTNVPPYARIAALALLDLSGTLSVVELKVALRDTHAHVREFAARLCESREESLLTKAVMELALDPDPRVRFQAALTLGAHGPLPSSLLLILSEDPEDFWLRAAVFSSAGSAWTDFFAQLMSSPKREGGSTPWPTVLEEAARITQRSSGSLSWKHPLIERILSEGQDREAQLATLSGLGDSLQRSLKLSDTTIEPALRGHLQELQTFALKNATNISQPLPSRLRALRFLGACGDEDVRVALTPLLGTSQPEELQIAAMHCWERLDPVLTGQWVLNSDHWRNLSPALRERALAGLLSRTETTRLLLEALENGTLNATAINPNVRQQLIKHQDEPMRARATKLFTSPADDRQAVFELHRGALNLPAEAAEGRRLFRERCASCHRLDREGYAVGPDLFGMRNQPKEAILLHIVIPNREIVAGFTASTVELTDERSLTGIIVSQTPSNLTLRQALGIETTMTRNEIRSITASDLSYMPEGLEYGLSDQDLANLLGYLKGE